MIQLTVRLNLEIQRSIPFNLSFWIKISSQLLICFTSSEFHFNSTSSDQSISRRASFSISVNWLAKVLES
ncbi:hypothetical protein WICPIJ_007469 [Wickerhamomyces pijperi]|uniref:Uncharacterized protein n=1 Tax=Wickerhamomyces pijperi TaxID=599730 RepID=A0A9P8Q1N1_WICPI|nr:hypothetical protein WICPIJ_007469 [Wickerhamomyces pijperi]